MTDPIDDALDDELRRHYGARHLDADALRDLRDASRTDEPRRVRRGPRPAWRRWTLGAVAAVGVALAVFALRPTADAGWPERAAAEIALNHVKALDPEVRSDDFVALGAAMPKLGFSIVRPARLDAGALRLVGGRYCSIGDAIAVQARLVDADGGTATLYQLRRTGAPLDGEVDVEVDGVRVTLWDEAGLRMGLARPTS